MSTITSLQALDFERRLNALENNVGITIARKRNNENNNNNKFESIDDRMAKIKLDLERKFARAASEATGTSPSSTGNTIGNNTNTLNSAVVHQRQQSQQSWKEIQKLLRDLDPGIALTHQQQPLLYKRQQVLAVSDELANDFSELDGILKLLMSGTRVDGAADARGGAGDTAPHTSRKIPKGGGPTSSSSSSSSPQKSKQQQQQQQAKKDLEQKLKQQQQQQQQQQPPYDTTTVAFHRSSGDTLRLDQVLRAPILTPAAQPPAEQKRVADLQHVLRGLGERTDALGARLRHFLECYHVATMAVSEKIVLADERITAFAANANAK